MQIHDILPSKMQEGLLNYPVTMIQLINVQTNCDPFCLKNQMAGNVLKFLCFDTFKCSKGKINFKNNRKLSVSVQLESLEFPFIS